MNRKRVLVVDDSPDEAQLVVEALADLRSSTSVDIAADGEEALDYLHRRGRFASREPGNPWLVLLDIKMPKVDGMELLRALKSDERTRGIPVIVFTSSREKRDVAECYRLGANAYVVKAIAYDELAETIRRIGAFWLRVNELPST